MHWFYLCQNKNENKKFKIILSHSTRIFTILKCHHIWLLIGITQLPQNARRLAFGGTHTPLKCKILFSNKKGFFKFRPAALCKNTKCKIWKSSQVPPSLMQDVLHFVEVGWSTWDKSFEQFFIIFFIYKIPIIWA